MEALPGIRHGPINLHSLHVPDGKETMTDKQICRVIDLICSGCLLLAWGLAVLYPFLESVIYLKTFLIETVVFGVILAAGYAFRPSFKEDK